MKISCFLTSHSLQNTTLYGILKSLKITVCFNILIASYKSHPDFHYVTMKWQKPRKDLIAMSSQDRLNGSNVGRSKSLLLGSGGSLLLGVVSLFLDLSGGLQLANQFCVTPSNFLGQVTQDSVVAVRTKSQHLQGSRDDNALLSVEIFRDALEGLVSRKQIHQIMKKINSKQRN